MRFLQNHFATVALCYGSLAVAKAVVGAFFEAAVYLVALLIHLHAAIQDLRRPPSH